MPSSVRESSSFVSFGPRGCCSCFGGSGEPSSRLAEAANQA